MSDQIARQLFNSANSYHQGATILMRPPQQTDVHLQMVQPAVTCAALSLKLYLKCMLAIAGKDKEDTIYRIADLYRDLPDAMSKLLLGKFDELSNKPLSMDELIKHLEALDNGFIKWRYIHEADAKSVNLEDMEEMILAAKATITTINPGWE